MLFIMNYAKVNKQTMCYFLFFFFFKCGGGCLTVLKELTYPQLSLFLFSFKQTKSSKNQKQSKILSIPSAGGEPQLNYPGLNPICYFLLKGIQEL